MTMDEVNLIVAVNRLVLTGLTGGARDKLIVALEVLPNPQSDAVWWGLHQAGRQFIQDNEGVGEGPRQKEALNCLEDSLKAYFVGVKDRAELPGDRRKSWQRDYGLLG